MRRLRFVYLCAGLVLLALTLWQTDLGEVGAHVRAFGIPGMAAVTALVFFGYFTDGAAWALTLPEIPARWRWWWRLFVVRTIGEAYNDITPLASLGGEPVKSVLLKTHYGIGYRRSGASLVLAKTTVTLSLLGFLGVGLVLAFITPSTLPAGYKFAAGLALAVLSTCTAIFFLIQRYRLTSSAARWLQRAGLYRGAERALSVIHEIDEQLMTFYVRHRGRMAGALALGFASWMVGVLEVWFVLAALGHPVSFVEAWIIEAMAQLVRAAAFFIPAGIGVQEGVFMVVFSSMFGSPALGVAVSVVRRCRQILWITAGVTMSWWLSLRAPLAPPAAAREWSGS